MKKVATFDVERERAEFDELFVTQAQQMGLDVDVLGDGPLGATVAIVGEAPGESEVRKRKPFVGSSGQLLWRAVGRYGFNPNNVYVTNVIKRQTSFGFDEKVTVPKDELEKWEELVRWELQHLPNVTTVLVSGGAALEALTGESGILNWRGSVIEAELPNGNEGHYVCTINPAYAAREPRVEIFFTMDCQRLDLVHRKKWEPHKVDTIINPTFKEARAWIRDMRRGKSPVALDVEHINGETVCYGFANNAYNAMCVNLRSAVDNRFSVSQEFDLLNDIQELCDSQRIIAHNGGHEGYWCWLRDAIKIPVWADSLLAHHTLYPQFPHGLGFLTTQYTTHPYYKDDGDIWKEGGDLETFWHYNGKDCAITWAAMDKMQGELKARKLDKFFYDHVMRAQPHLVSATVHGVKVDMAVKEKVIELCAEDVDKMYTEALRLIRDCVGDDEFEINLNSWQQLQVVFFDMLKLKGRGRSTDKTNRDYIVKDSGTSALCKEMITAVNAYKKEFKFFTTYANSRVSEDGRGRCDYKQYGVVNAPGRLSSTSLISGEGFNMQNIPVRARCQFVTDDDDVVFVYFDGSQAEARVVAYRADIPKWKADFERARLDGSYDCHRALCADMFRMKYEDTPVEDWDEDNKPTQRFIAKRCRHGLNYRMERERRAEVTQLPYHAASRAFVLYHKITPELEKWWAEEEKQFVRSRTILNAYGRELRVVQRIDENAKKSIIAFYPQSTIGDWITRAWYMIEEDDDWPMPEHARICIDVHDNLIAMCRKKYVKQVGRVMRKHAETPLLITNVFGTKTEELIIPAEIKVSIPMAHRIGGRGEKDKKGNSIEGKLLFEAAPNGLHRWSHMEKVKGL